MGPFFISKTVKVVAQIPCNVGETSKPRHSVPDVAPLIVAACHQVNSTVTHRQDRRGGDRGGADRRP